MIHQKVFAQSANIHSVCYFKIFLKNINVILFINDKIPFNEFLLYFNFLIHYQYYHLNFKFNFNDQTINKILMEFAIITKSNF